MRAAAVVEAVRGCGVSIGITSDGQRLSLAPASRLTPELVEALREHKAAILETLRGAEVSKAHFAPLIRDAGEVLDTARAHFGLPPEDREPPVPPAPPGRDPLTHHDTDKAAFFRGVRRRDLEKREREGLPPWIRVVDGGAS